MIIARQANKPLMGDGFDNDHCQISCVQDGLSLKIQSLNMPGDCRNVNIISEILARYLQKNNIFWEFVQIWGGIARIPKLLYICQVIFGMPKHVLQRWGGPFLRLFVSYLLLSPPSSTLLSDSKGFFYRIQVYLVTRSWCPIYGTWIVH